MKFPRTLCLTLLSLLTLTLAARAERKPDVLFIAVDDLNDWVGCLHGHPQVKTPNIDRLAARGTLFTNAHCQAPICNASRASVLSGLRPTTVGLYTLQPGVRAVPGLKDRVLLPQHFAAQGYATFTAGKIYHDGSIEKNEDVSGFQTWGSNGPMPLPAKKFVETPSTMRVMDWGVFPEDEKEHGDWKTAQSAIDWLPSVPADQTVFLATGFRMPHVPCFAPQAWFDLYPDDDTLTLPPFREDDRADVPFFAWYLHWKLPEPRLSWLKKANEWHSLVRAYLASTSFMDAQVGRLVDAFDASGRGKNAVVVLWSDHGWHLGEKAITGKNTLWERSTRVPLIVTGPAVAKGASCGRPAELLDIYPTLIDLCGLPPVEGLEGLSLRPQLADANAPRERPALTTANAGNNSVRDERWRYTRYANGEEELYDHTADPDEFTNLAKDPAQTAVKESLARWMPATSVPAVPGSAHRLLVKEGDTWMWEGSAIHDEELEE